MTYLFGFIVGVIFGYMALFIAPYYIGYWNQKGKMAAAIDFRRVKNEK